MPGSTISTIMNLMAGDNPEVSIVMSVWNSASVLEETLRSILAQRGVELELIVINDGSADATATILERYALADRRIRVLHQENRGLTRSLIRGCAEARAAYIARHDAGDRSHPERLARQKAALDAGADLAFASCWSRWCGPEWEQLFVEKGTGVAIEPTWILDDSTPKGVVDGPTCHASVMFRHDVYERAGGYREAFRYAQDWDLWYRLAAIGTFRIVPMMLYEYRFFPDGISAGHRRRQDELVELALESSRLLRRGKDDAAVLDQVREVSVRPLNASEHRGLAEGLYFIGEALRQGGDARCRRYLASALRIDPLNVKAWVRLIQALAL